ncbi:MAG TPA: hypothetical protein VFY36_08690 [Solirubrobacteraceae bacterium]|nr:hypothetical protein [Solirubrobacteraceae bacterium]
MKGNRRQRMLGLIVAVAAAIAAMTVASPALATPEGEFAVFAQCPLSNPALSGCIAAKSESGEFVAGKQKVPITNPITLQGGFIENEETGALAFVGAANGQTLSKSPQPVPGGLAGLVNCKEIKEILLRISCELTFENGLTGVNATTELAAPASSIGLNEANLLGETGTALSLPVKVHLENPFLGSSCYLGSNAKPIVINFTTGTTAPPLPNKPIKGKLGTITVVGEGQILKISNNSLVNNSFAAPGASGCGGFLVELLLNPIINGKLGLPAAAGNNTAILNGTLQQAGAEPVREH